MITSGIENLELYKEIIDLSTLTGIPFELRISNKEMDNLGSTIGNSRGIIVTINSIAINDLSVIVHELLHVKLHLMKYPFVSMYNGIVIDDIISSSVASLSNSLQHTYIFEEMKNMHISQKHIDEQFALAVLNRARTNQEEHNQLIHAVNFLELYLRNVEAYSIFTSDSIIRGSGGFRWFKRLKEIIDVPPKTPIEFRAAYIGLFQIIDEWIFESIGMTMDLKQFLCVDPVFDESELSNMATQRFYIRDIQKFQNYFILDKYDEQCSLFISKTKSNGEPNTFEKVQNLLDSLTLADILKCV